MLNLDFQLLLKKIGVLIPLRQPIGRPLLPLVWMCCFQGTAVPTTPSCLLPLVCFTH